MTNAIADGFHDPVFQSQEAFRQILDALANPGTIRTFAIDLTPPDGLDPASAIALLTLTDFETPAWLSPSLSPAVGTWLRFHAGAPQVDDVGEASFAVLTGSSGEPALSAFSAGDDLYPDRSATLIIRCDDFESGRTVTLTGPGIEHEREIAPAGLPADFWEQFTASNARYPRGIDVILTSGNTIIGLPRSLAISISAMEAA